MTKVGVCSRAEQCSVAEQVHECVTFICTYSLRKLAAMACSPTPQKESGDNFLPCNDSYFSDLCRFLVLFLNTAFTFADCKV